MVSSVSHSAGLMPTEEALRRLRAEIIAPDWRLTDSRISRLEAALVTLRLDMATRRDAVAVVTMAENVLLYIRRRQALDTYLLLAFLKEAVAQAVSLHEEAAPDPHQDARTFRAVYQRFQAVKRGLQTRARPVSAESPPVPPTVSPPEVDFELYVVEDDRAHNLDKKDDVGQVVKGLARDVKLLADRLDAQGVLLERLLVKLDRPPQG